MLTEKQRTVHLLYIATTLLGQLGFVSKETREQGFPIGASLTTGAGHTQLGG